MKSLVGGASVVLLLGAVMSGQSSNAGTACERLATLMVRAGTDHAGRNGSSRNVHAAWWRGWRRISHAASLLPRGRHAEAVERFRYQD